MDAAAEAYAKLISVKQIVMGCGLVRLQERPGRAQVEMKKETVEAPVDQFTMAVAKNPEGGGMIVLSWENTKRLLLLSGGKNKPAPRLNSGLVSAASGGMLVAFSTSAQVPESSQPILHELRSFLAMAPSFMWRHIPTMRIWN